jgi:putative ATPase
MKSSGALFSGQTPLAVRMRPTSLGEVAGQRHLLGSGSPIVALADPEAQKPGTVSVILWGPPGTGKTTLAQAIARSSGRRFVELSAITAGVKDVREVMQQALDQRDLYGQSTILFLDEIHRFTKAQQDALLPGVENGWVILIAATTENPSFSVISPLLSRSLLLTLKPLTDADLVTLVERAVSDARGLNGSVVLEDEARDAIVALSSGDARRALTALEAAAGVAVSEADEGETPTVTAEQVSQAVDRALLRYDRQGDEHYDVISAFIKSIRGSDPDAAIHYLARMIEAGEDPRFIARRLMVHAAEDIGMADPRALQIAVAAADPPRRGDHLPRDRAEVRCGHQCDRLGTRRCARREDRGRAAPSARRPLRRGQASRSRQGLSLPAQRPARRCDPAVSSGRAPRHPLLRADGARCGARSV